MLYVRSSVGVKKGIVLSNGTGIIDASYFSNKSNDGNIGLALYNTSDKEVVLEAGERIAQGLFMNYLVTDNDEVLNAQRVGGFGSSGN
jgi:dUTP pyrophosphatase